MSTISVLVSRIDKAPSAGFWILLIMLISSFSLSAQPLCDPWVVKVVSVQGRVKAQPYGTRTWHVIQSGDSFCPGDKINTAKWSRTTLVLSNNSLISLDQNSTLLLPGRIANNSNWFLRLLEGTGFFRSRKTQELNIDTPFINAVHRGTEFTIKVTATRTEISVFDGTVDAMNAQGNIRIEQGFLGIAEPGRTPRIQALQISPENAVQWALYYPPLVDVSKLDLERLTLLNAAYSAFQQGDSSGALTRLSNKPNTALSTQEQVFKAGLFLSLGRVDETEQIIKLLQSSSAGAGYAFALQSIIAVSKNQQQTALRYAQKAVSLAPETVLTHIALAYAYQSLFDIDAALASVQQAARLSPDNGLVWARLAELQLSMGNIDAALTSAHKAHELNPALAKTQTILGFAELSQNAPDAAEKSFHRAMMLDNSDPLARLGLGLVKISRNELTAGTQELETAVNLDPNNAVMRSYLGKVYYEQKNTAYAEKEFEIAKMADAKDPTPWFYDAILKQSTNRPVEALQAIQKAIDLNDNRGVYRSRLLLDEDLAARAVSQARIYNNLGFDQLAVNASTTSLSRDQANYSAHRFLFDSYAQRPRYEGARVSELLQAQLLQPVNMNPVQPETVETNLNILAGTSPSSIGFNEFTALFNRNKDQFIGSGTIGNHDTYADQAVLAGVHNRFSYSLGQFHYQNHGFRDNFALKHDLYNVFTQVALSDKLNVQFEYRHRETLKGDLTLDLRPSVYSSVDLKSRQDTPRLGVHYAIDPHSDVIFSFMYADKHEPYKAAAKFEPVLEEGGLKNSGYDLQGQYLSKYQLFNLVAGFSYFTINNKLRQNATDLNKIPVSSDYPLQIAFTSEWFDTYLYAHGAFPKNFIWTAGLSYISNTETENSTNTDLIKTQRVNPKFGLEWSVFNNLKLRLGYFETVKRTLLFEQTIEPTQIARFNQIFDDANGTIAKNKIMGLDMEFSDSLYGGLEIAKRDLALQHTFSQSFEPQKENVYRAYLYWTPDSQWTVSTKFNFEQFSRSPTYLPNGQLIETTPSRLFTLSVPIALRYFNPNGLFWTGGVTYVHQTVTFPKDLSLSEQKPEFTVLDTSIGYRLPKRWGLISLEVKNLLDNHFEYQDNSALGNNYNQPIYSPDRTVVGRILLTF